MAERLPLRTLCAYTAGKGVDTPTYLFVGMFVLKFYTDTVGLDPRLISAAFCIRFLFDAFTDPVVGLISDRTHTRWGRRRPFLPLGAIPAAVCFWLLLTPPAGSQLMLFAYVTLFSLLLSLFVTLFSVPYNALAAELTVDYDERSRLMTFRRVGEIGGEFLGLFCLPVAMLILAGGAELEQAGERQAHLWAASVIALVCIVSGLVVFQGVREPSRAREPVQTPFWSQLKIAWNNRPFRILFVTLTLVTIADRIATAQFFFILEHYHQKTEDQAIPLLLTFFGSALLSVVIWLRLMRRFGKKTSCLLAIAGWAGSLIVLVITQWSEGVLYLIAVVMGFFSTGIYTVPVALAPDVVEWDEAETGVRREGLYAGTLNFAWKAGTGLCFILVGQILHLVGYRAGTAPGLEVVDGLRFSYAGLPLLFFVAGFVVFLRYPLTGDVHRQLRERITSQHNDLKTRN